MRMGKKIANDFIIDFQLIMAESRFNIESTVDYSYRAIYLDILKQIY